MSHEAAGDDGDTDQNEANNRAKSTDTRRRL